MSTIVALLALLASLLHVFIFYIESLRWGSPMAQKIFGAQAADELKITKFYAYNQGIYNLALAVIAASGTVALFSGATAVGSALVLSGCGAMLFAAVALFTGSSKHRGAAIKQGSLPLLAVLGALILL